MRTSHWATRMLMLFASATLVSMQMTGPAAAESVKLAAASPSATSEVDPLMQQMDANGCNANVCIYLTGSGLQVDRWRTTGYSSSYVCTSAQFLADGVLVASTGTVCGSGTFSSTWENPGTYPDGTQLCNTWSNITGKPCKTVHS